MGEQKGEKTTRAHTHKYIHTCVYITYIYIVAFASQEVGLYLASAPLQFFNENPQKNHGTKWALQEAHLVYLVVFVLLGRLCVAELPGWVRRPPSAVVHPSVSHRLTEPSTSKRMLKLSVRNILACLFLDP